MKKLIICLLAAVFCNCVNAQAPTVYHGINASGCSSSELYDNGISPGLGYYLDIHLKGRTWVFMQFDVLRHRYKYSVNKLNEHTLTIIDLNIPVRFAFRLGKEDAKFTYYPTVGFGLYCPGYYSIKYKINTMNNDRGYIGYDEPIYPMFNIGFETKYRLNERKNIAIGINSNYMLYGLFTSAYLKFGWNKYKK